MNEYQELANEIIDDLSDWFHREYGITYKDIKEKKDPDDGAAEEDRALIYGEDYYYFEDAIAEKIETLVKKKGRSSHPTGSSPGPKHRREKAT